MLYELFSAKISDYLKIVKAELAKWKDNSKEFLREYTKQWKKYTIYARSLVNVFRYLDTYYLKGQGGQSVTNAALGMFRDQIFMPNLEFLRYAILEEIRKDRDQEIVEIDLIKTAINHFVVIDYKRPSKDGEGQNVMILLVKGQEFEWRGTKSL